MPATILPLAETVAVDTSPVMTALPPSKLPDAVIVTPVTAAFELTLPARTLPVAVTVAVVTSPTVVRLPAATLPLTVTKLLALLNVNAAEPFRMSLSLNCICVLAPPASMLPNILPKKFCAVTLPKK